MEKKAKSSAENEEEGIDNRGCNRHKIVTGDLEIEWNRGHSRIATWL